MHTQHNSTPEHFMRYALAAAGRDWHVFPLAPGAKVPPKGKSWKDAATNNPDTIQTYWSRRPYNIGIATGPSRLVVIDLDVPKPGEKPPAGPFDQPGITTGLDAFALVCERAGQPLPLDTFTVRTRKGGTHLYYAAPEGVQLGNTQGTSGGLGWLIDTRAHGGYVVGPGSVVNASDGTGTYQVINRAPVAALPEWLIGRLTPPPLPPQQPVAVSVDTSRLNSYLRSAVEGEIRRVAESPPDGHNVALYRASVALGQLVAGGVLQAEEVTAWLYDAAIGVGQRPGEARRTIASGLRGGANRPRSVAA